nr:MAG TPA: hypothetical protein [Caudoviricetes sp.]
MITVILYSYRGEMSTLDLGRITSQLRIFAKRKKRV